MLRFRGKRRALFSGTQSEIVERAVPLVPASVRASGGVRVRFGTSSGQERERCRTSRKQRLSGELSSRSREPRDRARRLRRRDRRRRPALETAITLEAVLRRRSTSRAAEKIYRSQRATDPDRRSAHSRSRAILLDSLPRENDAFFRQPLAPRTDGRRRRRCVPSG